MVALEQHLYQTRIQFDKAIVLPRKLVTESVHHYYFCYCPLVGILFEVLRFAQFVSSSRKYGGVDFMLHKKIAPIVKTYKSQCKRVYGLIMI